MSSIESSEGYIDDPVLAEHVAWSSYNERNTLWMHNSGRISLHPYDVKVLSDQAESNETEVVTVLNGGLPGIETALRTAMTPEMPALSESGRQMRSWMRLQETVDFMARQVPTRDPNEGRGKNIKPFSRKEKAQFAEQNIGMVVDFWDGEQNGIYDTQVRSFTDGATMDRVIVISRLEDVGSGEYKGPIPKGTGGTDNRRVVYTLSHDNATASSQQVNVHPSSWDGSLKCADTTALYGRHRVSAQQIDEIIDNLSHLYPREGRVWTANG